MTPFEGKTQFPSRARHRNRGETTAVTPGARHRVQGVRRDLARNRQLDHQANGCDLRPNPWLNTAQPSIGHSYPIIHIIVNLAIIKQQGM